MTSTAATHQPTRPEPQATDASDSGQIAVFTLALLGLLLALGGLIYDGGTALDTKTQAVDMAESAARAGAQQLDLTALRERAILTPSLDPTRAVAAARAFLTRAHLDGTASATTAQVTVTVTTTVHTHLLAVIGVRTLTIHAHATARPVVTAPPAR
jgi:Flp pilus assembly protein TadG